jgi:arsenate reductase
MIYRQEGLKDKIPNMTEKEQYELLATNGMLVKRPMIVGDDFVLVGFKEAEWNEKLA